MDGTTPLRRTRAPCPDRRRRRSVRPVIAGAGPCGFPRPRERPGNGNGAPDRIRTCDLWLRRPTLYPTELRALESATGGLVSHRPSGRNGRAKHDRGPASKQGRVGLDPDAGPSPFAGIGGIACFGSETLVDPGAGEQADSRRRRSAGRRSSGRRRRHADTHLSRAGAFCNHIRAWTKRSRRLT